MRLFCESLVLNLRCMVMGWVMEVVVVVVVSWLKEEILILMFCVVVCLNCFFGVCS